MTLLSYRCNTNDIQLCNEIFIDNHVLQKRNVYAGWDESVRPNAYLTIDNIRNTYISFNEKFFGSKLPNNIEFSIRFHPMNHDAGGFTIISHNIEQQQAIVKGLAICPHNWRSRAYMEQALLHEMCHICQCHIVYKSSLSKCLQAYDTNEGHDMVFVYIMGMINESNNNTEGFVVEVAIDPKEYYL